MMQTLLSPRELAAAIGVSESSLKRWADDGLLEVTRTAGGHRRIPLVEAIRFIRESKANVVRPDILGMPELATLSAEALVEADQQQATTPGQKLFDLLNAGNAPLARGLVISWYMAGESIASICDGPIREAMTRMGELWKHGDDGIYREHHATDICIQSLNQLRIILSQTSENAPVALGGAPDEDPYMLPNLMCSTVLAECGYRSINVGPFSPVRVLINAIQLHRPRILWYSASAPIETRTLRQNVDQLAEAMAQIHGSVILGGRRATDQTTGKHDNVHLVSSMAELASYARGVLAAMRASTESNQVSL